MNVEYLKAEMRWRISCRIENWGLYKLLLADLEKNYPADTEEEEEE